ncbi:MAG: SDR family NAD(P)-dependent oxidoreductase [Phormidesmis sp.]
MNEQTRHNLQFSTGQAGPDQIAYNWLASDDSPAATFESDFESDFDSDFDSDIAVIAMTGRFPGAPDLETYWHNLQQGIESISSFSEAEAMAAGVDEQLLNHPDYVKANGILTGIEQFDAAFFDFSAREAELLDHQQRLFLECAWEVIEQAGYNPETYGGSIGVYAGAGVNTYLLNNLYPVLTGSDALAIYQGMLGNDKDFLASRVAYKLNLKGPAVSVQTACSTSLVAVHMAAQSLLNGECDMALAGGVSVRVPQAKGYLYQEGMILSPDGHCRAFDAQAQGTVGGNGVGVVVLKRRASAIADGDCIHAVIKGSAINNDGALKVGYTAPSVEGQAAVIAEAQLVAGVEAESVTYVETHGTGTPLGDPIEVAGLTQAFRRQTQAKNFCAIGSVKTNIGHLDAAAGVAGLIKTVLALKHRQIPPSLHCQQPNPKLDLDNSPFFVNSTLRQWPTENTPRRAGVSSFGIGGTNAHVVLEEAPPVPSSAYEVPLENTSKTARPWQLLLLSAKTPTALDKATANLAEQLQQTPDITLADVAYTLSVGRRAFDHRRLLVCQSSADAADALTRLAPTRVLSGNPQTAPSVAFMFPGQGAQYVQMAAELYQTEPTFRTQVDCCCDALLPHLGQDLRQVIYAPANETEATTQLQQTALTQPALFVIEYALAQLWMQWGVQPQAMIGHSIGEYVAATLAGVFSLEDALALVAARGQLMQSLPAGAMLAVTLSEADLQPWLTQPNLSLAAVNGATAGVVSGTEAAIATLEQQLAAEGVNCRRLRTSHGFHSPMMEPILTPFRQQVKQISLSPPQIPFISNVTGTWITAEEATSPDYWARHLRQPVRFSPGLSELLKSETLLLEVGPGRTLSTLAKQHIAAQKKAEQSDLPAQAVFTSIRHPKEQQSDAAYLLTTLGKLWLAGVTIDWSQKYAHEQRRRLALPTYPFERQRYWVEPPAPGEAVRPTTALRSGKVDQANWFYLPSWKRLRLPLEAAEPAVADAHTLVFMDASGVGDQLVKRLEQLGQRVTVVQPGEDFTQPHERHYTLNPTQRSDYDRLLRELTVLASRPQQVIHLWSLSAACKGGAPLAQPVDEQDPQLQMRGFYSLLFLAQALGGLPGAEVLPITVVSNQVQSVTGDEHLCPQKATMLGPCKVIPQEYPHLRCRTIDVALPQPDQEQWKTLIDQLWQEIQTPSAELAVAYRGRHRWVQTFEPLPLAHPQTDPAQTDSERAIAPLKTQGVYLITGGLGGIGQVLAHYLAKTVQARLILTGRSAFPDRDQWVNWLADHAEDDRVSQQIQQIQMLEDLGAEVLVISADVANLAQMQAAIAKAEGQFGPLNGVIHAAGCFAGKAFATLAETTPEFCEQQFHAKIQGTLVLQQLLGAEAAGRSQPLDFCLLMSSLSSILGGLGFSAYAAANRFLDAFAHQQSQKAIPWLSINWEGWQLKPPQPSGQPSDQHKADETFGSDLNELALTPAEGVAVLQRLLGWADLRQVVVSTGHLSTRIERWVTQMGTSEPTVVRASQEHHSRPHLANAYVAPSTAIEQTLVEIWQTLLGVEPIGIHDNFLDLGGHSLLATQVMSRVREAFHIDLPLHSLFDEPTVAVMAERIELSRWADSSDRPAAELESTRQEGRL